VKEAQSESNLVKSPSSVKGENSKNQATGISSGKASAGESDKKSLNSAEFLSAEGNDPHSPPAEPPIDTHYKRRLGSKGAYPKRENYGPTSYVLTDNSLILKSINMNKM
jgi:hypothetical protein